MRRIAPDRRAEALLAPVAGPLGEALGRLPEGPSLAIRVGDAGGFARLEGDSLVVDAALEGPALTHPLESDGPLPPLDRWRRALASVLEGVVLRALAEAVGSEPGEDWRWRGIAVHLADRALPEAGLALPDLALALTTGAPGAHPRAGVAAYRAAEARGDDPWAAARAWVVAGCDPDTWLALGARALGSGGIAAELPVLVERVATADIPLDLAPWTWQPLHVPAHPRGGHVGVQGTARVAQPWAPAGAALDTLATASEGGGALTAEIGFPAGPWEVASARAFGQVFGARGLAFHLAPSGTLRIVLADAFVGPIAALEVAEVVGTSGVVTGRWQVDGPHRIRFARISNEGLTMHGRQSDAFRVPTPSGQGMGDWLAALKDSAWTWEERGSRLVLEGEMMGGRVEMHWKKSRD